MASMAYPVLLVIFIFGAVTGFINDSGLYSGSIVLPQNDANTGVGTVTEISDNAQKIGAGSTSYLDWILIGGRSIAAGIVALFTLGPIIASYGVPLGMTGMLISPLGIIAVFWVLEYWTGRSPE